MKRAFFILLPALWPFIGFSQDSLRTITHEAGVNIFRLLSQVTLFNPPDDQLPYDLFYNVYFRKAGVRTGLGINNSYTETDIEGQQLPRVTTSEDINFRLGVSYNLVRYQKVTINLFADYIWQRESLESATTSTIQVFPNPITTRTVKSANLSEGRGGQGGVGLMLHINRHIALYTETAVNYIISSQTIEDLIRETGEEDIHSKTTTESSGTRIALPVTVYLVFRI